MDKRNVLEVGEEKDDEEIVKQERELRMMKVWRTWRRKDEKN